MEAKLESFEVPVKGPILNYRAGTQKKAEHY
jgi:hypothetical protein